MDPVNESGVVPAPSTDATYWHETDLEPDDVLAIMMLPSAKYVVVGEGDVNIKFERASRYYSLLGYWPEFLRGHMSNKPYHCDGEEFDGLLRSVPDLSFSPALINGRYADKFHEFARAKEPVMVSLKPMRELFGWYLRNSAEVLGLIKKVTLYAYGGFNFRNLLTMDLISGKYGLQDELVTFLRGFKNAVIYESFHVTGARNSMNRVSAPLIYKMLDQHRKYRYVQALFRLIGLWNRHIVKEIQEEMRTDTDPESCKRSRKILESIQGNEDFQFVVADFGLAALMCSNMRPRRVVNFRIEDGYTKFDVPMITRGLENTTKDAEPSSIAAYCGLDLPVLICAYIDYAVARGLERIVAAGHKVDEGSSPQVSGFYG